MPQETSPINTTATTAQKTTGAFWSGLTDFVSTLAQPAAQLYALKIGNDTLTQQAAGQIAAANAANAQAAAAATQTQATQTRWLLWGGLAVIALVAVVFAFRKR